MPNLVSASGNSWGKTNVSGGGTNSVAGTEIEAGLPNITGETCTYYWVGATASSGALFCPNKKETSFMQTGVSSGGSAGIAFDASRSNPIYGKSTTVQPPAYVVYIWQRIA